MYILKLLQDPWNVFFFLVSVVVAVTVHEFAHAWASDRLGDPTARLLGRKSLDPRRHLDPWGSVLFLLVGFGWGKPVPVDSFNLRDEHKDNALIALAGPVSNIIMATAIGLIHRILPVSNEHLAFFFFQFASINVFLAVFNLLPIPPLDGSKLYRAILPDSFMPVWRFLDQYGVYILLFLFLSGSSFVSSLLFPIADTILRIIGF